MKPGLVEAQLRRLTRKHPRLEALKWRHCPLGGAPLDDVSRLIYSAWRRAYGDRITIAYKPALFRLALACARDAGVATLAEDDTGLCGVIAGLPMDFDLEGAPGEVTLTTGLCSAESWEGGGIIEMLLARHAAHLLREGHAFSFHWRAGAGEHSGNKPARLFHAGQAGLYAKALDCRAAARLGHLPWWQALGVRMLSWRHTIGKPLPSGVSLAINPVEACDEIAQFLTKHQPENGLRRVFHNQGLAARCRFVEEGVQGAVLVFREAGQVVGTLWGYVNPVNEGDAYFAVDGAVFHPEAAPSLPGACLSAAEGVARGPFGCFAIMAPGSVCALPLDRLGYLRVRRYYIGAAPYHAPALLTPENVAGAFLELR